MGLVLRVSATGILLCRINLNGIFTTEFTEYTESVPPILNQPQRPIGMGTT